MFVSILIKRLPPQSMEPFPCLVFLVDHLVSLLLKSCPVKNMVLMWCTWVILVYIMKEGSVMMWFEEYHEERTHNIPSSSNILASFVSVLTFLWWWRW
jgi:hypothetical protein